MLDLFHHNHQHNKESSKTAVAVVDPPHWRRRRPSKNGMMVTLVDAGMVAQLTDEEGSVFIGLLSCLGSGNGREAAHFALLFSHENHHGISPADQQAFTDDMQLLFQHTCRGYGTNVDVGEVLRGVLGTCVCVTIAGDSCVWSVLRRPLFGSLRLLSRFSLSLSPGLIRKYQIRIDANYATLVVNVLCIESLARQTFPTYNVLDAARPLLESYRRLCYTHTGVPKPNARRSRWVQLWLSVMYWKKALWDRHFFRTEAARRRRKFEGLPVPTGQWS